MKSSLLNITATLSLIAIALAASPRSAAQADRSRARDPASSSRLDITRGVLIASIYAEERSLRHYAGQTLWNTEGAGLGTLRDFIVHPGSNRIRYAVVSSGGLLGRIGNSLRLVPFEVMQHDAENDRLVVDILHARWLQIPPVRDEDYVADRFPMNPTLHQELAQRFGSGGSSSTASAPRSASPGPSEFDGLVRASEIRGKTVSTPDFTVGRIENIILDLNQGVAAALVDASRGLIGTTAKYLIPLQRLAIANSRQDPITTSLTRADFDRAQPSDYGLQNSSAKIERAENETPAPTGRTQASTPARDAMTESARAVRQALDNNSSLARENIQVVPENGKIILHGSVRSQRSKDDIEEAARRAARNGEVESRITVER